MEYRDWWENELGVDSFEARQARAIPADDLGLPDGLCPSCRHPMDDHAPYTICLRCEREWQRESAASLSD